MDTQAERNARARRVFGLAVLVTVGWLGLNAVFPAFEPTGIPSAVVRLIIDGLIAVGLWRALARTDFSPATQRAVWLTILIPFVAWQVLVWMLALRGMFMGALISAPIPVPLAIVVPFVVGLAFLLPSKRVASVLAVTPPSWLIGVQLYRVIGGIFVLNWLRGTAPALFALPAGIGDVTVGLLALPTAVWAASGTQAGKRAAVRWNVLGLIDFAVATATGILSTTGSHPYVQIGAFPMVLIPTIAVPSSIILHVLSLRQLRGKENAASVATPGGIDDRTHAAAHDPRQPYAPARS
jgi:hypothetical protein